MTTGETMMMTSISSEHKASVKCDLRSRTNASPHWLNLCPPALSACLSLRSHSLVQFTAATHTSSFVSLLSSLAFGSLGSHFYETLPYIAHLLTGGACVTA